MKIEKLENEIICTEPARGLLWLGSFFILIGVIGLIIFGVMGLVFSAVGFLIIFFFAQPWSLHVDENMLVRSVRGRLRDKERMMRPINEFERIELIMVGDLNLDSDPFDNDKEIGYILVTRFTDGTGWSFPPKSQNGDLNYAAGGKGLREVAAGVLEVVGLSKDNIVEIPLKPDDEFPEITI